MSVHVTQWSSHVNPFTSVGNAGFFKIDNYEAGVQRGLHHLKGIFWGIPIITPTESRTAQVRLRGVQKEK